MPLATMRTRTSSGCGAAGSRVWISKGCERAGTMAAVIFLGRIPKKDNALTRRTQRTREGREGIGAADAPSGSFVSPSRPLRGAFFSTNASAPVGGLRRAPPALRPLGKGGEEVGDGAVEGGGLVEISGMAGVGDHDFLRAGDLGGHVIGGGEEMAVIGADQYQGRDRDCRQRVDQRAVGLRQHAAGSAGEADGRSR